MAGSGDPVGQVLATRAGGDHLRALDLASTAVAQLDGAALVSVLIELGELLDVFGEWAEAESILSRAVALAESLQGDDAGELLVRALAALAYAQGVQCHYAETAATLQRARAFAIAGVTASQVFVHSAALEVVRGRFTEALAWIERAESIAQSATIGTERDKALVAVLSARANVERAIVEVENLYRTVDRPRCGRDYRGPDREEFDDLGAPGMALLLKSNPTMPFASRTCASVGRRCIASSRARYTPAGLACVR